MKPGDVYALNDPYHGGTHLPDITVITPVFNDEGTQVLFYVGSRGHHADVGGITPGSVPPDSTHIDQEGVRLTNWKLVESGRLREREPIDQLLARSEEHTSELQSLMRISYAVFCLKNNTQSQNKS